MRDAKIFQVCMSVNDQRFRKIKKLKVENVSYENAVDVALLLLFLKKICTAIESVSEAKQQQRLCFCINQFLSAIVLEKL